MECSSINFDDLPSSISEFFTPEEFAEISDYEKQHLSNLRQNFEALRRAVLPATAPDFMFKNRIQKERWKLASTPVLESSDESDTDWTPALERPKKQSEPEETRVETSKEGIFKELKRKITRTNKAEETGADKVRDI